MQGYDKLNLPFSERRSSETLPETLSVFSCKKMISKNVLSIGGTIQLNVWKTRKLPSIPTARRGVSGSEFVIRTAKRHVLISRNHFS